MGVYAHGFGKQLKLLELTIRHRLMLGSINTVVVVKMARLALKSFCFGWLVDPLHIPTLFNSAKYAFDFGVVVKSHPTLKVREDLCV